MKIKIIHPLWSHVASLGAVVSLVIYLIISEPLPEKAAVHFSLSGVPEGYGSPWQAFSLVIAMSLFFIMISFLLDELWARQETSKKFNWMSLFDEVVVGGSVGTGLAYLKFIKQGDQVFIFPLVYVMFTIGIVVAPAILLELLRPFKAHWQQVTGEDTSTLERELSRRLPGSAPLVYWDVQNPLYVRILATVLPVVMFVEAMISWYSEPVLAVILLFVGGVFVLFHGGQRTIVTRRDVRVRYGILGLKPLHLKVSDITSVELHSFAPLRDFGGYGIRFNSKMRAYFLSGTRGVKLTTEEGKNYLIGSDYPDRLATVIRAVVSSGGRTLHSS